jgi:hypothetical protein
VNPHPRVRKTVKWGGTVVCALLAVVWIGSVWWYVGWWRESGTVIGAGTGGVGFDQILDPLGLPESPGIQSGSHPRLLHWWFHWENSPSERSVFIPIWAVAILLAMPTAAAWRLDTLARRRTLPNHCPTCNYDRTGVPAGSPCPECGSPSVPTSAIAP